MKAIGIRSTVIISATEQLAMVIYAWTMKSGATVKCIHARFLTRHLTTILILP